MAILSLDQGTTSSRAILFSKNARVLGMGQVEFEQYFPRPGWVEHDPKEIWQSQLEAISQALLKANLSFLDVHSIGITNQRETTVMWDKQTGEPVYNAIVWQDRRTAAWCAMHQEKEAWITAKTGLLLDPYFSVSKIIWILENVPRAKELLGQGRLAFGTVESWLVWNLTAGEKHVSDYSNASRTMLMDLQALDWDQQLLDYFAISRDILPTLVGNSEVVGRTKVFDVEVPIAGLIGDQQAALFGQMCLAPGSVKNTYGTGCFLLMNTGSVAVASNHRLLSTVAWVIQGNVNYALEGSVFDAGSVIKWLKDSLNLIADYNELEQLVSSIESNDGVYMVPAFSGLGAPHWDPYARGILGGLTRATTKAHMARAAVEGIAFQVDQVLQSMQADSGLLIDHLKVDGGVSASDFLLQFQSDLSAMEVMRTSIAEATALGAAYMAGLATGFWQHVEDLVSLQQGRGAFHPQISGEQRSKQKRLWQKAVARSQGWAEEL